MSVYLSSCVEASFFIQQEKKVSDPSGHVVLGALATLRDLPVDVLLGRLDVACLAVDAAVGGGVSKKTRIFMMV
jgi:hypothetical protein